MTIEYNYSDNNGERVTEILHANGCSDIHCTSVLDSEAGVMCWYGVEDFSGRIFEDIAVKVSSARCMAPILIARNLYASYLEWLENGRPHRWEVPKCEEQ